MVHCNGFPRHSVREEGESEGAGSAWMFRVLVSCEDPTGDILFDLRAESMRDSLGNALMAESGVTKVHLEVGRDYLLCRCLRTELAADSDRRKQAPKFSIDQYFGSRNSAVKPSANQLWSGARRVSLVRVTTNCTTRGSKSRIVEAGYQGYDAARHCPHTAHHTMANELTSHSLDRCGNRRSLNVADCGDEILSAIAQVRQNSREILEPR